MPFRIGDYVRDESDDYRGVVDEISPGLIWVTTDRNCKGFQRNPTMIRGHAPEDFWSVVNSVAIQNTETACYYLDLIKLQEEIQ